MSGIIYQNNSPTKSWHQIRTHILHFNQLYTETASLQKIGLHSPLISAEKTIGRLDAVPAHKSAKSAYARMRRLARLLAEAPHRLRIVHCAGERENGRATAASAGRNREIGGDCLRGAALPPLSALSAKRERRDARNRSIHSRCGLLIRALYRANGPICR